MSAPEPKKKRERYECCKAWDDVETVHRQDRAWQVLHQMSHSRVPFSLACFADLARLDEARASYVLAEGRVRKLIGFTDEAGLYVGRLAPKRR